MQIGDIERAGLHQKQANTDQNGSSAERAHDQIVERRGECASVAPHSDQRIRTQRSDLKKDKDIEGIIKCLPKKCEILVTNLKTERSAKNSELALICKNLGYYCKEFESVKLAIDYAKNNKTLITGSFYTVSEARKCFKLKGHSEL